ncbi:hypothetical protein BC828DRAFT_402414 [Blastocladiella britannica]|nr:hypothetical protein BC828DRAFT_402414 [Blastocladiella britannica]
MFTFLPKPWAPYDFVPLIAAIVLGALYRWTYHRQDTAAQDGYQPLAVSASDADDLDDNGLETVVLPGTSQPVPKAAAAQIYALDATFSALRILVLTFLVASTGLQALALPALAAGDAIAHLPELLHFVFTALLTVAVTRVRTTRLFSVMAILLSQALVAVIHATEVRGDSIASATAFLTAAAAAICIVEYFSVMRAKRANISAVELKDRKGQPLPPTNLFPFTSFLEMLTFGWISPQIDLGYKRPLQLEDVCDLTASNRAKAIFHSYSRYERSGRSFWVAFALANWRDLVFQFSMATITAFLSLSSPFFVNQLLAYLEHKRTDLSELTWEPFGYVAGLFVFRVANTLIEQQRVYTGRELTARVRAVVNALLFRKTLTRNSHIVPSVDDKKVGDVNVLIGSDTSQVVEFIRSGPGMISTPLQLILAIASLYYVMGWPGLMGVAVAGAAIPLQSRLGKLTEGRQDKLMAATDARVKKMNELLQGIRIVKYFALEEPFMAVVHKLRAAELIAWRNFRFTIVSVNMMYHISPTLTIVLTLLCYTSVAGHTLDVTTLFTALALFRNLSWPLYDLPERFMCYFQTKVAVSRIQAYLNSPDLANYAVDQTAVSSTDDDLPIIGARGATLRWPLGSRPDATVVNVSPATPPTEADGESATAAAAESTAPKFSLADINVTFPIGKLSVILGPTGSGKSSILQALLGELELVSGQVYMPREPVGYVPQQSWLMNATVKENILFGSEFDAERYDAVLEACALKSDLKTLEHGDGTQIGERGVTLSGGQQQRTSLARAVYAFNTDIMVLDDVLSAVDAPTGAHLFHKCILGDLMRNKTRLLVSHAARLVVPFADHIVYVIGGQVAAQGATAAAVAEQLASGGWATEAAVMLESTHASESVAMAGSLATEDTKVAVFKGAALKSDASPASLPQAGPSSSQEEKREGKVGFEVYWKFFLASGGFLWWFGIVIEITLPQVIQLGQDWWLQIWAQNSSSAAAPSNGNMLSTLFYDATQPLVGIRSPTSDNVAYYLGIYVLFWFVRMVMDWAGNVLELFATLRVAKTLHDGMLKSVFGAPISFFASNAVGRLTNRFARDMETSDREMLQSLSNMIWCITSVGIILTLVAAISPLFLLLVLPIGVMLTGFGRRYNANSRELKRLEAVTRSPIFSLFQETSTGASVVRAFRREHDFEAQISRLMDTHHRPYLSLWGSNSWLSVRLLTQTQLVVAACGVAVLLSGNLAAGTAGIALTWVQSISEGINFSIRTWATVELNAISVERIIEYSNLDQETQGGETPTNWPMRGDLTVHNLTMKYATSSTPVLRGVSFSVPGKTKIGVVGRTGAGKSTLALALLRMMEAEDGYVEIDGKRTRDVSLNTLRSRVTMVPQDPVLFEGTLRSNLDVIGEHDDATCWNALQRVHFFDSVNKHGQHHKTGGADSPTAASSSSAHSDGIVAESSNDDDDETADGVTTAGAATSNWTLDSPISPGGKNLSVGQRQLLALARALVRRSKVIIMDESTANVSHDLDAKIQVTVRDEFKDSTILVIAHRLRTVCDFDKILVLDHGEVVEFGSPYELILRDQGTFRHMCSESGEFDHLLAMAQRAADL